MVTSGWKQECAALEVPSCDVARAIPSTVPSLAFSHFPISPSDPRILLPPLFRPHQPEFLNLDQHPHLQSQSARTTPPFLRWTLCTVHHPNKFLSFLSFARSPAAYSPSVASLWAHTHYKDGWSRRIGACFRFLGGWLYAKYKSLRESEEWAEEKKGGGEWGSWE